VNTLTDADYYKLDCLSFSKLKHILNSPRKFFQNQETPFAGTAATNLGNAIHCWIQNQQERVSFLPDLSHVKTRDGRIARTPQSTTEGKQIIEDFKKTVPADNFILSCDCLPILINLYNHYKQNYEIQEIMSDLVNFETPYFAEIDDLKFKGKLDAENRNYIIDFKTTYKPASKYSVAKHLIYDEYYHMQLAIYGLLKARNEEKDFRDYHYKIIFFETEPPYDVKMYTISHFTIQQGLDLLTSAINKYKHYIINKNPLYELSETI
jgi:ATP-dependent exoDNAse (exonuclease V) beta subunit